jgi:hypothetical protein
MEITLDGGARHELAKQALHLGADLSDPHIRLSLRQDLDDGTADAAEFAPSVRLDTCFAVGRSPRAAVRPTAAAKRPGLQ